MSPRQKKKCRPFEFAIFVSHKQWLFVISQGSTQWNLHEICMLTPLTLQKFERKYYIFGSIKVTCSCLKHTATVLCFSVIIYKELKYSSSQPLFIHLISNIY